MSQIEEFYHGDPNVLIFSNLDDLDDQVIYHTCEEWGDRGTDFGGFPLITGDIPNNNLWGSFNTGSAYPSTVYIDHSMTVHYKANNPSYGTALSQIQQMLDKLYNALLLSANFELVFNNDVDNDELINPGDSFDVIINVMNKSFSDDNVALNVNLDLISDEGIIITSSNLGSIGNINAGEEFQVQANIQISESIEINDYFLNLIISTDNIDDEGDLISEEFQTDFSVTLNQAGFPVDISGELISSAAIADLDHDGADEIISSDKGGFVHVFEMDGSEWDTDLFPYYTGDQNWGSPAVSDLDGDGDDDVVISSKNGHIYVFDQTGLLLDFDSGGYITATPAIADIDGDGLGEIIFGQYGGANLLYAINLDGTHVTGFPYDLDEKVQRGVALADFNDNGKADIVVGTDDEFIHLINDDGTLGWSYETGGDIRVTPTILELNGTGEKIVLAGSKDDNFYALNSDGTLRFMVETDDDIATEASVVDIEGVGPVIFFASGDFVYAVESDGDAYGNWPMDIGAEVVSSIIFSDFDGADVDCGRCLSDPEIIIGDLSANINAITLDGSTYNNFPISYSFPFKGSPTVLDTDADGDLELLLGSTQTLTSIDIKENGDNGGYWNTYRSNMTRNGHFISSVDALSIEQNYIIEDFSIISAYPNPFNPSINVDYFIALSDFVDIKIIDIEGKLVENLSSSFKPSGYHSINWNPENIASGVYFMKIATSDKVAIQKLMFLK